VVNFKIVIAGIFCLILSALLYLGYGRLLGSTAAQPGMSLYMGWFFAGAALISVLIVFMGLAKPR
jgi:hypothetical protein